MDERAYARYMTDVAYFLSRLEQNPNSKYFMPIALAYNKMEKYGETIAVCRTALERYPSYCPVKTLLAEALVYKGEAKEAKQLLFDVITEDPDNYKALRLLGTIYKSSDETGEALKYFKSAYIRAPEDEDLKRIIEEMGASVSPDDLFEEYMKKNQDSLWGNADEKSYKDIEKHIRTAEVMMSDIVADKKISEKQPSNSGFSDEIDFNVISDDDLNKLLSGVSGATAAAVEETIAENAHNDVKTPATEDFPPPIVSEELPLQDSFAQVTEDIFPKEDEAIEQSIENSADYSELENMLEAGSDSDNLSSAAIGFDVSSTEADDVLAALGSSENTLPSETLAEVDDVLAALGGADENNETLQEIAPDVFPNIEEENNNNITSSDNFTFPIATAEEKEETQSDVFVLDESVVAEKETAATPIFGRASPQDNKTDETAENTSGEEIFILDENALNAKQGFDKDDAANASAIVASENSDEKAETIADTIVENNDFQELNVVQDIDNIKTLFKTSDEDKIVAAERETAEGKDTSFVFKLEDMIGDDKEEYSRAEVDMAASALGESAPFTQKDILDEIFAASENAEQMDSLQAEKSYAETSEPSASNKLRAKAKLLHMQARLAKLKKG